MLISVADAVGEIGFEDDVDFAGCRVEREDLPTAAHDAAAARQDAAAGTRQASEEAVAQLAIFERSRVQ
jgi:hypothetical protein